MTMQWSNLGINALVWVCCGLASGGVMLFKGEARLWAIVTYVLTCMFVGEVVGLIWPIVR